MSVVVHSAVCVPCRVRGRVCIRVRASVMRRMRWCDAERMGRAVSRARIAVCGRIATGAYLHFCVQTGREFSTLQSYKIRLYALEYTALSSKLETRF